MYALIAYSSVSHMGLIIIRTLSNSKLGQYGRILIILTHGLTSSCILFLTNMCLPVNYNLHAFNGFTASGYAL